MKLSDPATLAQLLILAFGIYLLLSFLRSTRGSGLVRGLGLMLIVGVYGLWGVASQLGLLELKHVIQGLLGFVFVILAIIFQPELRRGIASLSENPLLGRFLKAHRQEVISEVAAAVVAMAKKKQGALIAFERRTPLDTYIEGAVKIDAEVNRYLLDSLFHHGNALHDGAVIISGDRVVAAASLFPLTENIEISKSTGTRHRAALGVTEETDAVTVAVSEETGYISICKRGKIERRIPRAQLEEVLRDRIGSDETSSQLADEPDVERVPWALRLFTEHVGQKLAAFVLAGLVFYGAHQEIIVPKEVDLDIKFVHTPRSAAPGELVVVGSADYRLTGESTRKCKVEFEGTRDQLEAVNIAASGLVVLDAELTDGELTIDVGDVDWGVVGLEDSVKVAWKGDAPTLAIETLGKTNVALTADMVEVGRGRADPRYEIDSGGIRFLPNVIEVRGPRTEVQALDQGLLDLDAGLVGKVVILEPVKLTEQVTQYQTFEHRLAQELRDRGLSIERSVIIEIPIRRREAALGTIDVAITLQRFEPNANGDAQRQFQQPSEVAQYRVVTRGLIAGEEGSDEWIADSQAVRNFVREHLRAFVDVSRIPEGSSVGTVAHQGLDRWRELLVAMDDRFKEVCKDQSNDLTVELVTDPKVKLIEAEANGDEGDESDGNPPGGEDT